MIAIDISNYLKRIFPCCPSITNQGDFVSKLFVSAGSSYFSDSKYTSNDYQRKIYNGSKPITENIKSSFPTPINIKGVSDFLVTIIDSNKVRDLMLAFGIPQSNSDVKILSQSLTTQFQLFISSTDYDIDDIVAAEYQKLLYNPVVTTLIPPTPLYQGDSAWVLQFVPQRSYAVCCYDTFQHEWVIRNNGTQTWRNRKLCFSGCKDVRPRASENCIDIPTVPPGQDIKITANFDARGFEGIFDCIWEMQDSDDINCFPNERRLFCITIKVEHK